MSLKYWLQDNVAVLGSVKRNRKRGWIGGVCAGFADYYGWNDDNLGGLRVAFILGAVFAFFPVVPLYLALWWVLDDAAGAAIGAGNWREDRQEWRERHQREREARRAARHPWRRRAADAGPAVSAGTVREQFAGLEERLRDIEECVSSREFHLRRQLRDLER